VVTSQVGNIFGADAILDEAQEEEPEGSDGYRKLGKRRIAV